MGITNVNEQGSAYGAAFRNKPVYFMTGKETEAFFDGKMRRNMELREDTCTLGSNNTFLHQKERYDQLEAKLRSGIQEQMAVVKALEQELDSMPNGLLAVDEQITVDKLTREVADAFVEKVIVKPGQQVEIEWKFAK